MRATSPLPVPLSPRISTVERALGHLLEHLPELAGSTRLLPISEPRLWLDRISLRSDSFSSLRRCREASSSL